MKYNIDFDQWSELPNPGWHNIELNKTIGYYINKYPVGTKVRIRKDSKYYKENTKNNPKDTIGEIYKINFDDINPYLKANDIHIIRVTWLTGCKNSYRVFDLEYYKEY
jgi:hypothetical protein